MTLPCDDCTTPDKCVNKCRLFWEQVESRKAIKFYPNAKPGDIMDDRGVVRVELGPRDDIGSPFYGVEYGEVFVTKEQAAEAAQFGWVLLPELPNDLGYLVRIKRDAKI